MWAGTLGDVPALSGTSADGWGSLTSWLATQTLEAIRTDTKAERRRLFEGVFFRPARPPPPPRPSSLSLLLTSFHTKKTQPSHFGRTDGRPSGVKHLKCSTRLSQSVVLFCVNACEAETIPSLFFLYNENYSRWKALWVCSKTQSFGWHTSGQWGGWQEAAIASIASTFPFWIIGWRAIIYVQTGFTVNCRL